MKIPASEIKYRIAYDEPNGERHYVHFSGLKWTSALGLAWVGTRKQVRGLASSDGYQQIRRDDVRLVRAVRRLDTLNAT